MAVESVFVSSVIGGFEAEREAAAVAIEQMGLHPVRSERVAADAVSPRRALLDEVAKAEIYLLLLGRRYGDGSGAKSPTEEEFEEALRRHKPILVVALDGELDPDQEEFLTRVRGSWGNGRLSGTFTGPGDIGAAVAGALSRLRAAVTENAPAAQERAAELARGEERGGYVGGSLSARVAFAPLRQTTLLDAVALEEPTLGDGLAADLRTAGAVPQSLGVAVETSAAGARIRESGSNSREDPVAAVLADGSVVASGGVACGGTLGGMAVDPERLEAVIAAGGRFAQLAWDRIDPQDEISQVAVAVAIPDVGSAVFGCPEGGSMSMSSSLPSTILAPAPALVAPRLQMTDPGVVGRLVAEIRRIFADAGAAQE